MRRTNSSKRAAAGKGPDIWIWPHDRIGGWIDAGLLQPVTPSKEARAAILPLAWNAFTVGGKTWGYLISIEAVALVYNKDLVPTPPKPSRKSPRWTRNSPRKARKPSCGITRTPISRGLCWARAAASRLKSRPTAATMREDGREQCRLAGGRECADDLINSGAMPKAPATRKWKRASTRARSP
jgi:maltose/maltodextrin transport system substrate-binding protein